MSAQGLGRWGGGLNLTASNPSKIVMYGLPRAPLISLASLQHANIGSMATDASNAIGNSFPPPAIPKDTLAGRLAYKSSNYVTNNWPAQPQFDLSWAANQAIWDRYFFSGFNWGKDGNSYKTQEAAAAAVRAHQPGRSPFANPRVHLTATPTGSDALLHYDTIAKHLAIKGAFNINSTSEEAWKAVLAGLDDRELAYQQNNNRKTGKFPSPLSRFTTPQGDEKDIYRGFRSLSDKQIGDLAKEIVQQVKLRGPFMGLADFVNRRLSTGPEGDGGALQAAIDKTNINSLRSASPDKNITPNAADSTEAGLPGYLTEADILTSIGANITARSDTFKIRAYGDVNDSSGNVIARAWCEAVVQRVPEWTTPTTEEPTMPNPNYPSDLDDANDLLFHPNKPNPAFPEEDLKFGRRLVVVGFRWLSPEEV